MTASMGTDRFHLQVNELIKEYSKTKESVAEITEFIQQLIRRLKKLKNSTKERHVKDLKWLRNWNVKFPLQDQPACTSETRFTFKKPSKVELVGSAHYSLIPRDNCTIDIAVQMPKACFTPRDYLNQIYFRKKALYLCYIAHQLDKNPQIDVDSVKFGRFVENPLSICLILTSKKYDLDVRLLPYPEEGTFQVNRFLPNVSNLRSVWYHAGTKQEEEQPYPSPRYNSSIQADMLVPQINQFVKCQLCTFASKTAVVLLQTWMRRRECLKGKGAFSSFLCAYLVAYMKSKKFIHDGLSPRETFRTIILYLAESKWRVNDGHFGQHFDVVFMDCNEKINLAAPVSLFTYDRVKFEAAECLSILDSQTQSSFETVFLTPAPFFLAFDNYFSLRTAGRLENYVRSCSGSMGCIMDAATDFTIILQPILYKLLVHALGSRIVAIDLHRKEETKFWELEESPLLSDNKMVFGIVLNVDHAFNALERGPPATDIEACSTFRQLWRDRSSLRKFADGSMCEAVVWPAHNEAQRRLIPQMIIQHLLNTHFNVAEDQVEYVNNQMEHVLCGTNGSQDTRESDFGELNTAYSKLARGLRLIEDLPLQISAIQSISPALRACQVDPPLPFSGYDAKCRFAQETAKIYYPVADKTLPPVIPTHRVQLTLESSGKWPDNLEALRRLKNGFLLEIEFQIKKMFQFVTRCNVDYIDILVDGFVFRLELIVPKELRLLKMVTDKGEIRDTQKSKLEFVRTHVLPKTCSYLQSLSQRISCFSLTVRLAERWIEAHMLTDHVPPIVVELLVAYIFVQHKPMQIPGSPLVGFCRFLHLLCTVDWILMPLVVNFNDELKEIDIDKIQSEFESLRPTLPLMCVCTPCDLTGNIFTQHKIDPVILDRLCRLAENCWKLLQNAMHSGDQNIYQAIFVSSKESYDGIIYLKRNIRCREDKAPDDNKKKVTHMFPVVDFDPCLSFYNILKESYGHLCLFFYDAQIFDEIPFLWKPNARKDVPFKMSNLVGRKRSHESSDCVVADSDAFKEDVLLLGDGIVDRVEFG